MSPQADSVDLCTSLAEKLSGPATAKLPQVLSEQVQKLVEKKQGTLGEGKRSSELGYSRRSMVEEALEGQEAD